MFISLLKQPVVTRKIWKQSMWRSALKKRTPDAQLDRKCLWNAPLIHDFCRGWDHDLTGFRWDHGFSRDKPTTQQSAPAPSCNRPQHETFWSSGHSSYPHMVSPWFRTPQNNCLGPSWADPTASVRVAVTIKTIPTGRTPKSQRSPNSCPSCSIAIVALWW